ncbi:hypothetical protein L218DRAFT_987276 [Marasmius fiardii PR-910]|nr:hypothetical protein L218DRAFT_987276 [Marasmius fiardii PR-910]
MALSSTTIIIIAICASVGVLVLFISSRFFMRLRARKSSPLPPKQPLAHHRATYYQTSAPVEYFTGARSSLSLASKERFAAETSTGQYYVDEVRYRSLPSFVAHPPVPSQSEQRSGLALPTPSFYAAGTNSDTSLVSRPSFSDGSHTPNMGAVPFPPDMAPDPNPLPTGAIPTCTVTDQNSRPRPLSYVSTTSSHRTTRSRTTRSFSSHSHGRRSGLPHDPTAGVQIVLPAPLAPTYTGSLSSVPTLPRGAGMPENRLSFVDAWVPNANRERESSVSSIGSKRLHRPRSSLHISHSPSSSSPPSPCHPPSPPTSNIPNTPSSRSREPSLKQPRQRQRPATAPHHHWSHQHSSVTPSPVSSRSVTPSASPPDVEGDQRHPSAIISPGPPHRDTFSPVRSETFYNYNVTGAGDRPPPISPKLQSGVPVVVSS